MKKMKILKKYICCEKDKTLTWNTQQRFKEKKQKIKIDKIDIEIKFIFVDICINFILSTS